MGLRAICSVSLNSVWSTAWPAAFATHRRNGYHQGLGHIVTVSLGQNGGQGDSFGICNHMVLAPRFASVSGIGSCFSPHPQPPGWTHYPQRLGTNQSGQPLAVWTAASREVSAKPPLPATPLGVASRSSQSRTPSPGVTSPTESRSSRQRGCRLAPAGCPGVFAPDRVCASVSGVVLPGKDGCISSHSSSSTSGFGMCLSLGKEKLPPAKNQSQGNLNDADCCAPVGRACTGRHR